MEALANLVIAAADLAEAEGRSMHRALIRFGIRLIAILIGGLAAATGLVLVMWGIYQAIEHAIGPVWASLICGLTLLIVAAGLFMYGRSLPKKRIDVPPIDLNDPAAPDDSQEADRRRAAERKEGPDEALHPSKAA